MKKLIDEAYKILSNYSFLPLGNSSVQNIFLVPQEEYSTGRKLRAYYLRLWDRVQAAEENYLHLKEKEIEIKKLEKLLEKEKDELEAELIRIKIARIKNSYKYIYKLFIDCMKEIDDLIFAIKELPEINLQDFEMEEFEHFKKRMIAQATETPQINTLKALGYSITENGEVYHDKENLKNLLEKRVLSLSVGEKYENIKKLFLEPIQELPKFSIEDIVDINISNMLPEPEKK